METNTFSCDLCKQEIVADDKPKFWTSIQIDGNGPKFNNTHVFHVCDACIKVDVLGLLKEILK